MTKKTKAWWVCGTCKKPIAQVKSQETQRAITEHRKVCTPTSGCGIKQLPEGTRAE